MTTAIILPHRERYAADGAGAIALTVAGQCRGLSASDPIEVWGDPLAGPSLLPEHDDKYYSLALPWWPPGRQSWRYQKAIERMVRERCPKRLEIHNRASLFQALRRQSVGLGLYLHNDPWTIRGLKTSIERRQVVERADYIVCVSEFLRERYCADLPADLHHRVVVVPNTVDLARLQPSATKRQEILFVGRLIPDKGVMELVEALLEVLPAHPEWSARVIGARYFGQSGHRFEYEKDVVTRARALGEERIIFSGYQSFDKVAQAFREAAIAVVPSRWQEPFGRTALEAMAAGCAVVSAKRGGLPDVVGDAGLLVEPEVPALAQALEQLMSDAPKREALGARAAERARSDFAPAAVHAHIRDLRLS